MMKMMEKLMDKLSVDDKNQIRDQNDPQVRNPSFRRQKGPLTPQIMQRGKRNPNDQQIRPPFQENLVDEEFMEQPEGHIHHYGKYESRNFLTKDEHDSFLSEGKEEANKNLVIGELDDYHKSYLNSTMNFQNKYNLRSINVVVVPPKKAP